jgi:KUP system potassium uptake protein
LGNEHIFAAKRPGMALWREHLFAFLSSNCHHATDFFRLPPDRVVELGAQIEL